MAGRALAMVANFHRERRIGRKTANFLGSVHAHLRQRGIQFNIEFVLDRPDELTLRQIELAAHGIEGARVHVVDFGNLGSSRTFGVHAARADVVCFTDGDDFFSMNWFEGALDYLSQGPRNEVLHTQYMVGFDHSEFVRETMESGHPAFDPLSLAVDWYWSANLAVQTEVFAATPIDPYDHAAGFGSEDWHWACSCLAAGVGRVSLPHTSYYYRVKPERYSLGRVGDVIHPPSPIFTREGLPPPPLAPTLGPIPVEPLSSRFFAQAREIEPFERGVSYLRAIEVGSRTIHHFMPHTHPIVGTVLREALGAGFGNGSVIVLADNQRLAGGLKVAAGLCTAVTGSPGPTRLYLIDGDKEGHHPRPDGYVISLGELRAAGLDQVRIERLVARFILQARDVTVLNLLSPRVRSTSLAFFRATRRNVGRWINVVTEYGFDALSQVFDELADFEAAGIDSQNIAVFRKTVREAFETRGVVLAYDEALETDYVAGGLGARIVAPGRETALSGGSRPAPASPAEPWAFRMTGETLSLTATDGSVALLVDDDLRALAEQEKECILVSGGAFLGMEFGDFEAARPPGLRIPALTIVNQEAQPTLYVRHSADLFNQLLASGRFPADLAASGAIGVDCGSLKDVLRRFTDKVPLSALIEASVRRAREEEVPCVELFSPHCVVSATVADLDLLDKAALARSVTMALARGRADA